MERDGCAVTAECSARGNATLSTSLGDDSEELRPRYANRDYGFWHWVGRYKGSHSSRPIHGRRISYPCRGGVRKCKLGKATRRIPERQERAHAGLFRNANGADSDDASRFCPQLL